MAYVVPLHDIRFALTELAGLDEILALPGFEELSPDLIDAVLTENARFVQDAIAPTDRAGDTQPPVWQDGTVTTTPGFIEAYRAFAAGGWQGLSHPAEFGGQGLPKLVATPCVENLNAANLAFSLCPLLTDGVIEALLTAGSHEQQQRYVPALVDGSWTGTMNLTEPQAGSDLALVTTRAVPQDDGSYRLHGQKIFITFGEHDLADNIIHLVLARTPGAPDGIKGLSLFIVPKFLPDDTGARGQRNDVWCASIEHKLGIHGSPTAVLLYGDDHGEVGPGAIGYRIGEENRGLQYMFIMMNAARFAVGLQGIAVSERATQLALAYAADRVQSRPPEGADGPVPIVQHPDVQRLLLTMRALTEAARAVACVAAAAFDRAAHHPDESVRQRERAFYEYLVPIVKGFSTEGAVEVASLGVQVHGGMGFIEETGAAQLYRDARILPIYEGTTAIQANDLVGRKTLRDAGATAGAIVAAMRDTLATLRAAVAATGTDTDTPDPTDDPEGAALASIARRFAQGIDDYEAVVRYMLGIAPRDVRAAFAGSVPYLMLAGYVHGGWQMARAALACVARQRAGEGTPFHTQKFLTARFYAEHLLPRTMGLRVAIVEGAGSVQQPEAA